jgi:hypothetical protein
VYFQKQMQKSGDSTSLLKINRIENKFKEYGTSES